MNLNPPTEANLTALARVAASATLDDQLALASTLQVAADRGFPLEALYETMLQLVIYIGYPRTIHGMTTFRSTFPAFQLNRFHMTEPWRETAAVLWPDRGAQVFAQLWGQEALIKSRLSELSPELAEWVLCDGFGRIFGRPGLTLMEREAIVLGSLFAQGATREINTHRRGILHVGGYEGLIDALLEGVTDLIPGELYIRARETIQQLRTRETPAPGQLAQ